MEDLRAEIEDDETFSASYYNPSNYSVLIDHGTSHMAVVDGEGNAISLTTTVNLIWGSTVMTEDGKLLVPQYKSQVLISLRRYHSQ